MNTLGVGGSSRGACGAGARPLGKMMEELSTVHPAILFSAAVGVVAICQFVVRSLRIFLGVAFRLPRRELSVGCSAAAAPASCSVAWRAPIARKLLMPLAGGPSRPPVARSTCRLQRG
jgi:hypothetical protein